MFKSDILSTLATDFLQSSFSRTSPIRAHRLTPPLPRQRVDDTLTRLAEQNQANDRTGVKQTMQQLVQSLSAREHKWLVRVVLKEVGCRRWRRGAKGLSWIQKLYAKMLWMFMLTGVVFSQILYYQDLRDYPTFGKVGYCLNLSELYAKMLRTFYVTCL